jgi:hypothetical protein
MAAVLFGVGATKAGTSWLYRELQAHPGCRLRAVKEFHYWDSFDPSARERQLAAFAARRAAFATARDRAAAAGAPRAANLARQVEDWDRLIAVVGGDRTGDLAYRDFLTAGAEGRLVADITPAYGLLPEEGLGRMLAAFPGARVLYLLREPVARLWSQVRMEEERAAGGKGDFADRANARMARVLRGRRDGGVLRRGDYREAGERLGRVVPAERLRLAYFERLFEPQSWAELQLWLGLEPRPADMRPAHEGARAPLDPVLAAEARRVLAPQYDWAEAALGPLPAAWRQPFSA